MVCVASTYAILLLLYINYSNISRGIRKHIVSQDISRQTAQLFGQQISTLLPKTPESVATALGFGPINKTACHARGQFGKGDGAKNVCLDRLFKDSMFHSRKPCVVLSFGIDFDFSFDLSMSKLGCTVHSFDPVMMTRITVKGLRAIMLNDIYQAFGMSKKLVVFHDSGLGHQRKNNKLKTLKAHAKELNLVHIDVLKIDIEGNEWHVMETLIRDLDSIHVDQICIEIHLAEAKVAPDVLKDTMKHLNSKGYALWSREDNWMHSKIVSYGGYHIRNTYELSFVRVL